MKNRLHHLWNAVCQPKYLYFYYLIALILPNLGLSYTEPLSWLARLTNVVLPLAVYAQVLTFCRKPGKMIWILFPLVFIAAFQLVLLYLFGRSVIAVDMFLNVVTTNPGEAMELLDNLIPGVAFVFMVYLPALILGACTWRLPAKLDYVWLMQMRKRAMPLLIAGMLMLATLNLIEPNYKVQNQLYPINAGYNLCLAIDRATKQSHYAESSKAFTFEATSVHQDTIAPLREVYVLFIGETARAANFSLYGYARDTNPLLSQTEGLVSFSDALTESNTTHKSVPMLLSALSARNFNQIYYQKGLITAFREAGFRTLFLSNQRPNHSFIDYFGMEAESYHFIQEEQGENSPIPLDADLLKGVEEALHAPYQKLLIVLHTYGSHFNYRERYPRAMAHFTPDDETDAKYKNRASLVNAYDNSLRYTDAILSQLTALLAAEQVPAAWLYTSDHGEDLFDDDRRCFLHASPLPTYYQIHVPLLVWLSPTYRAQWPEVYTALQQNAHQPVSTSLSLFHTLLHVSGVNSPLVNTQHALSSPLYEPEERLYLDDHNQAVSLKELGLDPEDEAQFAQRGISY